MLKISVYCRAASVLCSIPCYAVGVSHGIWTLSWFLRVYRNSVCRVLWLFMHSNIIWALLYVN